MKTLISLVLTAFLFVMSAPMAFAHQHAHGEQAVQNYDCPMHPEVTGKKGDTCPKCGMNLEVAKGSADTKNCPHGKHAADANVHHEKSKCDNCPKHQKHHKVTAKYDCPMHPEVTGSKGDTCPKCGMNLEPVKTASSPAQHQHH
ncbi:heavy metal-binding domain-containing protein [Shewanella colwelliana]|jgi:uncharacterized protein with PIN domain|uniref:Heavy metal binding domain-containing protein n=1 Tax=Shewanella colwelliana TaxID=23 RepID=A0A1E5ITJ4_SHECO|nr:heavy metal-binding domain-containing protein [Shewanella colwelliana]MCZ4337944.1 heavy metal-binding domain-containing protein [Shewanella colwelliana]MDX1281083.1 heavy metal-binding domain-containing protein [Shewanella colwelliana]OEG73806.1 hypothetical protein BEL05_15255 [Shewanella colwelliana]GIU27824.1 hypothetical protein TUM4644_25020 [Shewanella colwelliana]